MYRPGHYGAALLTYAPFGLFVSMMGYETAAVVGCVLAVGLSTIPDYDYHIPLVEHRGPTHTLLFAVLVGIALAGVTSALVGGNLAYAGLGVVAFAFAVGTLSIVSHLLADLLTPAGIQPFWPLSNRRYTLDVTPASSTLANYALLALGVVAIFVTAIGVSVLS